MSAGDSRPPSDSSESTGGGATTTSERDHDDGVVDRFLHDDDGPFMFLREVLSSAGVVVAIGVLLFVVAGVWPPMVAVESGSMEPHMQKGDLILITEPGRFAPEAGGDSGVVTYTEGEASDYRSLGSYGSVIVYDNPNTSGPPIIHRAMFRVEAGENWYDKANPDYINADSCEELQFCPAPYDAYITKGDNNPTYDQTSSISEPVKDEWITGVARVRVPYLGWVRLAFASTTPASTDAGPSVTTVVFEDAVSPLDDVSPTTAPSRSLEPNGVVSSSPSTVPSGRSASSAAREPPVATLA
ncbi:S26 family signal peptidase [Haloprofundus halobius]|uniref:S26 family signal peptidase n=1 Tax=Haloprofundus halobius TaxID=2876194 RepID=UPI001CCDCD41|nr:S26 family signal peptidase [Haloprofundus halobius]